MKAMSRYDITNSIYYYQHIKHYMAQWTRPTSRGMAALYDNGGLMYIADPFIKDVFNIEYTPASLYKCTG